MGAALSLAAIAAACGGGSDDGSALSSDDGVAEPGDAGARTVEVAMTDNEFSPSSLDVAAGATVAFTFRNDGTVTHDAVIGDEAAQAEHEDEMRAAESTTGDDGMADMGHGTADGGDEAAITVEPGASGEITYTFDDEGDLLVGCHEPGHYDDGMRIALSVSAA